MDYKLNTAQQCALEMMKGTHALGCIRNKLGSGSKEMILPLYSSRGRPHLDYCIQLWTLQYKKDIGTLE